MHLIGNKSLGLVILCKRRYVYITISPHGSAVNFARNETLRSRQK